jgi:hypothetical protein
MNDPVGTPDNIIDDSERIFTALPNAHMGLKNRVNNAIFARDTRLQPCTAVLGRGLGGGGRISYSLTYQK